nr:glycosyltransferase family 4 protein [Phytoactinopolyspora halophila]
MTVVLSTSSGGVGAHVRSVVDRLPALGVRPHVVAPAATGQSFGFADMAARGESDGGVGFTPVEIFTRPRPRHDFEAIRQLRAVVRGVDDAGDSGDGGERPGGVPRPDVVHAHGFRAAALVGLALGRRRHGRTPLVATWHNALLGSAPRRAVLSGLERLAARRADVTLGASADLVQRARVLGAPDARLAPVAAPATGAPQRTRDEVRAELGAGDRPVVLAVGRLAPQKDYDTLLAAASHWALREPRPLLVIAGDGPDLGRLRRAAEDARVDVRFLGRRDDVADLLAAADVYAITSRWEARALVVQEAMLAGVPVVCTAVGGLPELVGDDAMLVPVGSPEAVAGAVEALLDDPARGRELAERGRQRARQWPDEDETARQLAEIYAELARIPLTPPRQARWP